MLNSLSEKKMRPKGETHEFWWSLMLGVFTFSAFVAVPPLLWETNAPSTLCLSHRNFSFLVYGVWWTAVFQPSLQICHHLGLRCHRWLARLGPSSSFWHFFASPIPTLLVMPSFGNVTAIVSMAFCTPLACPWPSRVCFWLSDPYPILPPLRVTSNSSSRRPTWRCTCATKNPKSVRGYFTSCTLDYLNLVSIVTCTVDLDGSDATFYSAALHLFSLTWALWKRLGTDYLNITTVMWRNFSIPSFTPPYMASTRSSCRLAWYLPARIIPVGEEGNIWTRTHTLRKIAFPSPFSPWVMLLIHAVSWWQTKHFVMSHRVDCFPFNEPSCFPDETVRDGRSSNASVLG